MVLNKTDETSRFGVTNALAERHFYHKKGLRHAKANRLALCCTTCLCRL